LFIIIFPLPVFPTPFPPHVSDRHDRSRDQEAIRNPAFIVEKETPNACVCKYHYHPTVQNIAHVHIITASLRFTAKQRFALCGRLGIKYLGRSSPNGKGDVMGVAMEPPALRFSPCSVVLFWNRYRLRISITEFNPYRIPKFLFFRCFWWETEFKPFHPYLFCFHKSPWGCEAPYALWASSSRQWSRCVFFHTHRIPFQSPCLQILIFH